MALHTMSVQIALTQSLGLPKNTAPKVDFFGPPVLSHACARCRRWQRTRRSAAHASDKQSYTRHSDTYVIVDPNPGMVIAPPIQQQLYGCGRVPSVPSCMPHSPAAHNPHRSPHQLMTGPINYTAHFSKHSLHAHTCSPHANDRRSALCRLFQSWRMCTAHPVGEALITSLLAAAGSHSHLSVYLSSHNRCGGAQPAAAAGVDNGADCCGGDGVVGSEHICRY